jgi:hypothetical protein
MCFEYDISHRTDEITDEGGELQWIIVIAYEGLLFILY